MMVMNQYFISKLRGCLIFPMFIFMAISPIQAASNSVVASYVPGLKKEFRDFDSSLWDKAGVIKDFKVPRENQDAIPAAQPTEVRIANDGVNFYFKIIASDSEMNKIKSVELDEFENAPPKGDHVEFWVGTDFLAFDTVGNKYEAHAFDRQFYSAECKHNVRKTKHAWELVVSVPIAKYSRRGKLPKTLSVNFIRHLDHGLDKPERSTASGGKPWHFLKIQIDQPKKQEKK